MTHVSRRISEADSQLDYIFTSEGNITTQVEEDLWLGSDHRPLLAEIEVKNTRSGRPKKYEEKVIIKPELTAI